jgi:solute carrier family 45 protein 1/2/4
VKLALYPFFIYNTDWMGREIYHGNPRGSKEKLEMYTNGFRQGSIGLIFSVIGRTVTTAFIPKLCQKLTARTLWALSNILLCLLMLTAVIISLLSNNGHRPSSRHGVTEPDPTLVAIALGIFALVGISGSITQCVPMALAFQIAAAEGGDSQGNAIGAISIAIVVPQVK